MVIIAEESSPTNAEIPSWQQETKVSDRRALPLKFHLIFLTEKVCGTDGHGYRRAKRSGKCRTGKPQSHRKHENIIKHNIKQASCNSADHGP